jgi:peptide/nickel transport system permease protein
MGRASAVELGQPVQGQWRVAFGSGSFLGYAGVTIVAMLVIAAVFGDQLAPHDPNAQSLGDRMAPPIWNHGSWTHALGTDQLGRDELSRIIAGARTTLVIGITTAVIEAAIGVPLGVIAGLKGGRIDALIMRWTDIQMAFPAPMLVLFVILVAGASNATVILALAINGWMVFARVARASALAQGTTGYFQAAVATGASARRLITMHMLPNLRATIITLVLLEVARVILAEAMLSFLGLGVSSPDVSWGLMLGEARNYITVAPTISILPGVVIIVAIVSLHLTAKWFEPLLDPIRRMR